ncbi:MAG: hypothetical protein EXS58_08800 [Candidatus Latescibacteria bacterium]|nr:hypothetical protein [Candidatus Latescibacterota bacterium]
MGFDRGRERFLGGKGNHKTASSVYLLTGLIKCSECGGNFIMSKQRGANPASQYFYYRYNYHNRRGNAVCTNIVGLERDRLEQAVVGLLQQEVLVPRHRPGHRCRGRPGRGLHSGQRVLQRPERRRARAPRVVAEHPQRYRREPPDPMVALLPHLRSGGVLGAGQVSGPGSQWRPGSQCRRGRESCCHRPGLDRGREYRLPRGPAARPQSPAQ